MDVDVVKALVQLGISLPAVGIICLFSWQVIKLIVTRADARTDELASLSQEGLAVARTTQESVLMLYKILLAREVRES